MKAAVGFDVVEIEDVRFQLAQWLDGAAAGDMEGEEMISRLSDVADQLDEAISHLRRALGW